MEIRFNDIHDIECGGIHCDPLTMYAQGAVCGDCPAIALARAFFDIEFEI